MATDQSLKDQLKLTYLVGQNNLSGRPNRPLIGRRKILDMFNFLVKKPTDLLFGRRLWTAVGSVFVGRTQKRYNRPVELCFVGLNDKTLVGSATSDLILKLSCGLIRRYIVLYFCTQKATIPADQS